MHLKVREKYCCHSFLLRFRVCRMGIYSFFCPTSMFPSSGNNIPTFLWGSLPFITQSWIGYQSNYSKKDMNGPRNANQIFLTGIWLKDNDKMNTIRNLGISLRNSFPLVPAAHIPRSILVMSLHPMTCLPGFLYSNSRGHFCGLQWKDSETFFKKLSYFNTALCSKYITMTDKILKEEHSNIFIE